MLKVVVFVTLLAFTGRGEEPCAVPHDRLLDAIEETPGDVELVAARFEEALDCFGAPDEETARSLHNLFHATVNTYYESGYEERALSVINRFFDVFAAYEEPDLYFRMYQWEGFIFFMRGELHRAVDSYSRSFAYTEHVEPSERAHLAEQTAILYQRLQDLEAARSFLQEAMTIMEEADYETDRARWIHARVLNTKASVLMQIGTAGGRLDREVVEQAAGLARQVLQLLDGDPPDAEHGSAHLRLAEYERYVGSVEEAARHLQVAQRLGRELESDALRTAAAHGRGLLAVRMEDWEAAAAAFQLTHDLAPPTDYEARAEAMLALGLLAELQGDMRNAESYYRDSIDEHALRRSAFHATEWTALDRRWTVAHRALVRSLLAQERVEEALQALDRTRAQHLHNVRLQTRVLGEASMETRDAFDSLTEELISIRHSLRSDTLSSDGRAQLLSEEGRLLAERGALLDLNDVPESPSVGELQRAVAAKNQVLLVYFVDEADATVPVTPRSHVFVVTADTLLAHPLETTRLALEEALAEASPLFAGEGASTLGRLDFSLEALHALYSTLIAPVAEHIPADARLVVVPDEPLHSLPFGLLVTEPTAGYRYASANFLLREHAVAAELAPRLVVEGNGVERSPSLDVLAFGRASFSGRSASVRGGMDEALGDLPAVRDELSAIRKLFRNVETALNEEATETALLEAIDRPAVLHLASHAVLDRSMPFRNAVLLAPDPADTTAFYDGQFHLHKLGHTALAAELVVLSGCDTAQGRLLPGEGMASLQYGFRSLGVRSSVATLWLVDDQASAEVMTAFYRKLRDGVPKDVALQQAQLTYLEGASGLRTSPFFWAAPVLYGSPRPIELAAPRLRGAPWLALVLGLMMLVGGAAFFRRYRRGQAGRDRNTTG